MSAELWTVNITVITNDTDDDKYDVTTKQYDLHIVAILGLAFVAAYGTIGNILIVCVVTLKRLLRKRSNVFVVNLAVTDLIICSYIMPLGLVTSQLDDVEVNGVFCNINGFLVTTCCGMSIQTMMLIAIERYFHICRVSRYRKMFTSPRISILMISMWIYVCLWSIQGFTGWTRYKYNTYSHLCLLDVSYSISYNIALVLCVIFAPVTIIGFCYFSIFKLVCTNRKVMMNHKSSVRSLHKTPSGYHLSKRQKRKENKELNVAFMLLTIIILFVLFWSPLAFVVIGAQFLNIPAIVVTIATWMALSNSALNSLVYGLLNRNFRLGYLTFINKCFHCRTEAEDGFDLELSNFGHRTNTNANYSESRIGYRSPASTTSLGLLDATQSRISEKSTPTKYGVFLDVPSPTIKKKLPKHNGVKMKYSNNGGLEKSDASKSLIPKIQIQVCRPTPSDELLPYNQAATAV